jgi:hypothetical protein
MHSELLVEAAPEERKLTWATQITLGTNQTITPL